MNLHGIVSPYVAAINPFVTACLWVSTGSTKNRDYSETATYAKYPGIKIQMQALSGRDLRQLEMLNIQGVTRKAWLNGFVEGLNRAAGKGGDLIVFASDMSVPTPLQGTAWLVEVVFETWDADGWCSVGLIQQLNMPK